MNRLRLLMLGILGWGFLAAAEPPFIAATGSSDLPDPRAAAESAGRTARDGLHGATVKLVLIHAPHAQMTEGLIAGITAVFPAALVYGGEVYAPLAGGEAFADQGVGIHAGVAVLAVAGTLTVTVAEAPVAMPLDSASYASCGTILGKALSPALSTSAPGKVVLTFGLQHTGNNLPFATALTTVLGPAIPVVGGAASGGAAASIVVRGQRRTAVNVGIALAGEFTVTSGHGTPGGDPLEKTRAAIAMAAPAPSRRPLLTFAIDSRTVRENLLKRHALGEEVAALNRLAAPGALFGFYGSGQIAPAGPGQAAQGMGHVLAILVVGGW